MTAKDKTTAFTAPSDREMRNEGKPDHAQELAAAAERFARLLRTAAVETAKTGQRDIRHVLCSEDQRLLWPSTLESRWHRYVCKPSDPSTIH